MTDNKEFDRLLPVTIDVSKDALVDILFRPLKLGRLVVLRVNDPRLPKKKRVTGTPRLFLMPYGQQLLLSLEGHGAEVVDPTILKPISFSRLGINSFLSEALATAVRSIYTEGEADGKVAP